MSEATASPCSWRGRDANAAARLGVRSVHTTRAIHISAYATTDCLFYDTSAKPSRNPSHPRPGGIVFVAFFYCFCGLFFPTDPTLYMRSDPARSTRLSFPNKDLEGVCGVPRRTGSLETRMVKMQWEREEALLLAFWGEVR